MSGTGKHNRRPVNNFLSEEWIWERVAPCPMSGCWLWTGSCNSSGYGHIGKQRSCSAGTVHRVMYEHFKGPINGLHVLHKCDTPACCNPDHLFLGTHADNMADKVAKGRVGNLRGSAVPTSKLTEMDVARIRERLATRETLVSIAADYGVSFGLIGHIKSGRAWRAA